MAYGKLNEQGQLISANTQLDDSFQELSLFEIKDEDGNGTGLFYDFYNEDLTPDTDKIANKEAEILAIESKANKIKAIEILTVTTEAGNVFDANDASRANMNEAITTAITLELTESDWKLADNTIVTVSVDEIREALALGIQAKGAIILG